MSAVSIVGGLILLVVGGELVVRGAVRLAERMGVSPLLIGLTLVGFGTSAPELVTSVQAALIGSPGIAVGNIVGSNLANVLLILGASALIFPLAVESRALKRDGGFVLATTLLFAAAGPTVGLNRPVGVTFIALLAAYMVYAYRQEGRTRTDHTAAFEKAEAIEGIDPQLHPAAPSVRGERGWLVPLAVAIAGLAVLVLGGRLLVDGALALARTAGVPDETIGLTIVALGTSLPELVTSLVAAVRKHSEVAVGNVLGSNIYNVLGIGGVTALIAPTAVPAHIARIDNPCLIAVTALLLLFAWTGRRLSRGEGAAFLALYVSYVGYLIAAA